MIESFKIDLVVRAAMRSPDDILRAMGYPRPTVANRLRLQKVLACPNFGLEEGGFDWKYRSEDFLKELCLEVGMDSTLTDQRIQKLKTWLDEERSAFKPYLWVDTGFVRRSQPLFALAVSEPQRYLSFPTGFWREPISAQLGLAQCRVRAHVDETR